MAKKKVEAPTTQDYINKAMENAKGFIDATAFIAIPKEPFVVGEPVLLGNLENCTIAAVSEDNRYVVVAGNRIDSKTNVESTSYVGNVWYNIARTSKVKESNLSTKSGIELNFTQASISELLGRVTSYGIEFDAVYQRELVWQTSDKQAYIDSVFANSDLGKFIFARIAYADNVPGYECVDGKQRMHALMDFVNDKFTYKGFLFSEISREDRYFFRNRTAPVCELGEYVTLEQKMEVFLRTNKGGVPQSPEHLQKVEDMYAQEVNRANRRPKM